MVTREDILDSMCERHRLQAGMDEMVLGQFYAEETDDGWKYVDASEQMDA